MTMGFETGGFPGSTPETVAAHPELSPTPIAGDQAIRDEVNLSIARKAGRRGTRVRKDNTSLYTQVTEEARELMGQLRADVRSQIPAKFMKVALTRKQVKARLENMSPEERTALTRKYGVRNMATLMQKLGVEVPNGSR